MGATIAQVVVDSRLPALDRRLDFRIPPEMRDAVRPGVRVRVPVRGRRSPGYVVGLADHTDFAGELEDLDRVLSPVPVLTPEVLDLAQRAASRSAGNVADVLRLAIPPRHVAAESAWLDSHGGSPPSHDTGSQVPNEGTRTAWDAPAGIVTLPTGDAVGAWAVGIAELVAATLASGRQAIVVVPDARDQRQLSLALADAVGADRILPFDAGQSAKERYRNFLRALEPSPTVRIGPRSTVYAPAGDLGLLVVWDDGDPLHREPLAPYVHARDAALLRHEAIGCDLVLASHARSTATQRLVELRYLAAASPPPAPRPKVVPTALVEGQEGRIPSLAFTALRRGLEKGSVLVQVAKPGQAQYLRCGTCGELASCERCGSSLVPRPGKAHPRCRACSHEQPLTTCAACGADAWRPTGSGSVSTASELGRAFPGVPVTVADGEHPLFSVEASRRIVVATPGAAPVVAGGYHAVVLLDGEGQLLAERLTVFEDAVRQWRGALALAAPDAACVVTGAPAEIALALGARSSENFASAELAERRALQFPPAVRIATFWGTPGSVREMSESLEQLAGVEVLATTPVNEDGASDPAGEWDRALVRFPYAAGAEVAALLRAGILRTTRSRGGGLRVHMDDLSALERGL